jgi:hypothetical protein
VTLIFFMQSDFLICLRPEKAYSGHRVTHYSKGAPERVEVW